MSVEQYWFLQLKIRLSSLGLENKKLEALQEYLFSLDCPMDSYVQKGWYPSSHTIIFRKMYQ